MHYKQGNQHNFPTSPIAPWSDVPAEPDGRMERKNALIFTMNDINKILLIYSNKIIYIWVTHSQFACFVEKRHVP